MLISVRHAWLWIAAAIGVTALFAGYLGLRTGWSGSGPPVWETVLVVAGLVSVCILLLGWTGRRRAWNVLDGLSVYVASLRENPSLTTLQTLPVDLGPLSEQLDSLGNCYRQALTDLAAQSDVLEEARRDWQGEFESSVKLGRADAEQGRSLFRVVRGDNNSRSMVARLTPNIRWMTLTPALQQLLGLTYVQLNGQPFTEVVHPEDREGLTRVFQEARDTGEAHNIVFRFVTQRGDDRHVQMDVLTRYNDQAAPLHHRCHFLDVTERVVTERELRRRTEELSQANARLQRINRDLERLKESYRDLYHNAPGMYFSLDPKGRLATLNETMLRTLGYTREELSGLPYTRLLAPECLPHYLMNPTDYQKPGEVETKWVKKSGTVIDVWIRSTPVLDVEGWFVRSRSAAQDMTEHNRLSNALRTKAEELQKANTQLRRINRELDDFTYVVSHDLKEPLRTIHVFSNFLAQDYGEQLGSEGQEYITHLIQGSRRLGSLIDDLLNLSRAGRITHAPQPFDLTNVMQTVCSDLADLIQRKGAVVRIEGPLPVVAGDPQRITQLLTNLVGNGLKYNQSPRPEVVIGVNAEVAVPRSEPELRLEDLLTTKPPEPEFVTLYVRDNGIGIDPKYHQRIFRIFCRLHPREEYEGTGAGLAICKKILEAHGGRVWVDSQFGQGATFYLTLPRPRPHDSPGRNGESHSGSTDSGRMPALAEPASSRYPHEPSMA